VYSIDTRLDRRLSPVNAKKVTYGSNRADFRFFAGGVVPGLLILKPDFPENNED